VDTTVHIKTDINLYFCLLVGEFHDWDGRFIEYFDVGWFGNPFVNHGLLQRSEGEGFPMAKDN
jgi:hypothetical protein